SRGGSILSSRASRQQVHGKAAPVLAPISQVTEQGSLSTAALLQGVGEDSEAMVVQAAIGQTLLVSGFCELGHDPPIPCEPGGLFRRAPLAPSTNQTGPASVMRQTSPSVQPARCRRSRQSLAVLTRGHLLVVGVSFSGPPRSVARRISGSPGLTL